MAKRKGAVPVESPSSGGMTPLRRPWTVLVYLCGDSGDRANHTLADVTLRDLDELARAGASAHCYVAIQHDCSKPVDGGQPGTHRYVLPDKPLASSAELKAETYLGKVNTGDAQAAIDFLRWGLARCPADRVAVVVGGLGITHSCRDCGLVDGAHERLFSICDDLTACDALDAHELRHVFRTALDHSFDAARVRTYIAQRLQQYSESPSAPGQPAHASHRPSRDDLQRRVEGVFASNADPADLRRIVEVATEGRPDAAPIRADFEHLLASTRRKRFDLVGMDMSATQYLEIAYQLDELVEVLVGSQCQMPQDAWPYDRVLGAWHQRLIEQPRAGAREFGKLIIDTTQQEYAAAAGGLGHPYAISALDLTCLDDVTRAFDTLSLALLQSVGDSQVFAARRRIIGEKGAARPTEESFDLVDLLRTMHRVFAETGANALIPPADRARVRRLVPLADRALRVIDVPPDRNDPSAPSDTADDAAAATTRRPDDHRRFIVHRSQYPPPGESASGTVPEWGGVSIYRPRELTDISASYLQLRFAERVHWAALLGVLRLVDKNPERLWDMLNTLLTSGGVLRDSTLRQLLGQGTFSERLGQQFRAMAKAPTLTLSLDPTSRRVGFEEPARLRARIESLVETLCEPPRGAAASPGPDFVDGVLAACASHTVSHYRLRLESPFDGATVSEHQVRVQEATIEAALDELNALLAQGEATPDELRHADALGQTLGEDVVQDLAALLDERRRQAAAQGGDSVHLCLQIPRALMRYPWELMHDRGGPLAQRYAVGRQVLTEARWLRPRQRQQSGALRVLVIGNPPLSAATERRLRRQGKLVPPPLPGAENEARQVVATFRQLSDQMTGLPPIEIKHYIGETVTKSQLRDLLRRGHYDLVHYAGHAVFQQHDPETSAWLLSDGELWAQEIRNTLSWCESPPWLVFANACEAGMDAESPSRRYQGDVFGLATAFIHQGVTAYIAPLWPVDDEVAMRLAVTFYRALLLEGQTLGAALQRAKSAARQPQTSRRRVRVPERLSWASFVLYGVPDARVLDSLWSPDMPLPRAADGHAEKPVPAAAIEGPPGAVAARLAQPTPAETRDLIAGPQMRPASLDRAAAPALAPHETLLELVEAHGVRYWRIQRPGDIEARPLAGEAARLTGKPQVQRLMAQRGAWDYLRHVGRWIIGREDDLIAAIAAQYDVDKVGSEQLLRIQATGEPEPLLPPDLKQRDGGWKWLNLDRGRVLLVIHGTISDIHAPRHRLGESFLRHAEAAYGGIIGFNHFTLSRTPRQNAERLWELLPPALRERQRLDVITHSRGGLVARAFVELLGRHDAVRRVVFAGTPNCGTSLASPRHIGRAADLLANYLLRDNDDMLAKLSGLLARMAASQTAGALLQRIPGLWAQNPDNVNAKGEFLYELQQPRATKPAVDYLAVAANYEPDDTQTDLRWLVRSTADEVLDSYYATPNDLVVDTAHVWAVDSAPSLIQASARVPARHLLVFDPAGTAQVPGARIVAKTGVDHFNLLDQPETRQFLSTHLLGLPE